MQPPNEDCSADTALKGTFDATDVFPNQMYFSSISSLGALSM